MISLVVPGRPLSLNNAYRNIPGRGRAATDELKDYHQRAMIAALQAKAAHRMLKGDLEARVAFYFPDRRADLDNHFKPAFDGLQAARVYGNDRQLVRLYGSRNVDTMNPRTEIAIGIDQGCPYQRIRELELLIVELEAKLGEEPTMFNLTKE